MSAGADDNGTGGEQSVIGNPYGQMLEMMRGQSGLQAALATLEDAREGVFYLEGRKAPVAGWARGLVLEPADEGHLYLCLGSRAGWFVVCPLEEV